VASRIVVKGASGSGKTTLAARLSESLDVPHVELDALFHGPGWTEPPVEEFRKRVAEATRGDGWVADGGYDHKLGDSLLERADLVVWLDPPRRAICARLWRRTGQRIREGTELWGGSRETWSNALLGWDSLFVYAARQHARLRRELPDRCRRLGVELVRLRSPGEVAAWLEAQTSTTTGKIMGRRRVRS
jgi:adenylate kinase family enzyme